MQLSEILTSLLPKSDTPYQVLNVASNPKKSKKLFQNKDLQTTIKTQHMVTVLQDKTPIFGIEVFVYVILYAESTERVLFVSKADTSGLFDLSRCNGINIRIGDITEAVLKYILKIPVTFYLNQVIEWNDLEDDKAGVDKKNELNSTQLALDVLLKRWKNNKDLASPLPDEKLLYSKKSFEHQGPVITKICLFTRPEPQYLFPYSNKNKGKHILSGDQLLKWWCKIINRVVSTEFQDSLEMKLLIPGAESRTIQRYLPDHKWSIGDIFSNDPKDLAIYRVPLFPDDPKSRFLEHLVVENRARKVRLRQFWLELSVRQEFRLGIVVGVIGISGQLKKNIEPSQVGQILKLKSKSLKKLKDFIVGEDYSKPDELEAYDNVRKLHGSAFVDVIGNFEPKKRTNAEIDSQQTQQPAQPVMMVVRKKKKT